MSYLGIDKVCFICIYIEFDLCEVKERFLFVCCLCIFICKKENIILILFLIIDIVYSDVNMIVCLFDI